MQYAFDLTGKTALVTGASRGIGRAIALALAEAGAAVAGTATTQAGADKITAAFKEQNLNGKGYALDVTDPESIDSAFKAIQADMAAPLILINNAGITQDNLFLRMNAEQWRKVIDTDLNALFYVTKACIKPMLKARWGRIIHISSIAGSIGNAGQANYCAAKAGILGFSKSLANEFGSRNITSNVVSPGFIETDMTGGLPEEQKQTYLGNIPLGRFGQSEDIAASVLFLASDLASYISGQTLHVNGGMYMSG